MISARHLSTLNQSWLTLSFFIMFGGLFIHHSHPSFLNFIDAFFFVPALFLIIRNAIQDNVKKFFPVAALPLYLFIFWALISQGWADTPNYSRTARASIELLILLSFLTWMWQAYPLRLEKSLLDASALVAPVLLVIAVSYYSQAPLSSALYGREVDLFLSLPRKHTIFSTIGLITPTFLLLGGALYRQNSTVRLWHVIAAVVLVAFVMLLQRRTGAVALISGFFALGILTKSRGVAILMATTLAFIGTFLLFDINNYAGRGASLRPDIWVSYLDLALERPWIGHGLSQGPESIILMREGDRKVIPHPHNIMLATLYFTGLVGLILFIASWASAIIHVLLRWNERQHWTILLAPLTPGITAMQFDGMFVLAPFHYNWMCLWFPLFLALALSAKKESRPSSSI
jgi:O-antigen ligase